MLLAIVWIPKSLRHNACFGGAGGGRLTLHQPFHDTMMAQYWVLATSEKWRRTLSTSRQWLRQSQLSIIL